MRDYQPSKNNPYWLPPTVYRRALATVRDYDRLKVAYDDILHGTFTGEIGMPRGGGADDPVERMAERLESVHNDLRRIDRALRVVPEQYRTALMDKLLYDRWPVRIPVGRNTVGYWKRRFLHQIAINFNMI